VAGEADGGKSVKALTPIGPPRPYGLVRAIRRDQRGTAVVEFALIAPLLFMILFGIIDFGRALNYYNQLTQLAGQGARAAAVSNNPNGTAASSTSIQTAIKNSATGGLGNGISVCITNTPSAPKVGQAVTFRTQYSFTFLPFIGALVSSPTITLSATQSERQEANPTYSVGCAP
jgi:Flp pilus assembly protein TadG